MKLDDDFEDYYEDDIDDMEEYRQNNKSSMLYTVVAVGVIFLVILLCVLVANNRSNNKNRTSTSSYADAVLKDAEDMNSQQKASEKSVNELLTGSTLTAQDLDFWDDYPDENNYKKDSVSVDEALAAEDEPEEEEDPATDGKHTLITYDNGKEEWVDINPYVDKNEYDFNNLTYQKPFMKYYVNNHKESFVGVDISKTDEYVDFYKLKSAGVDYVMIRLGQRGYFSGELTLDDRFEDNFKRAYEAGMPVGIYFYSQAISIEEAQDEADFVLTTISLNSVSDNGAYDPDGAKSNIKYPIVFYMEDIKGDDARTDDLTQMARTNIAIAFMDYVKDAGYSPMLYGNKEWLIKKYSFATLDGYDIWYDEEVDTPTFPYRFHMWRYTNHGEVNGIIGDAKLSISFIDYSIR